MTPISGREAAVSSLPPPCLICGKASFLLKLPRTLPLGLRALYRKSRQQPAALNFWAPDRRLLLLTSGSFECLQIGAPGGGMCPVVQIQRLPAVSLERVCGHRSLRQKVARLLVTGDLVAV